MLGQLIPNGGGLPLSLLKRQVIVGREPTCDVSIAAQGVSRKHCELKFQDGVWWVKDLDSRNGVGLNGKKVIEARLAPGDTLTLGRCHFRIRYKASKTASKSSPDDEIALSVLMDGAPKQRAPEPDDRPRPRQDAQPPLVRQSAVPSRSDASAVPAAATSQSAPSPRTPASGKPTKRRYLGSLVPCGGGDAIALLQPTLLVGRRSKCDVTIRSKTVSSRHCALTYEDGYWFVEDLNSHNGVRVNGERVDRRHLDPGDRISFASQSYNIQYSPEGEPPIDDKMFSKSLLEKAGLAEISRPDQPPPNWLTEHEEEASPKKFFIDDPDSED